MNAHQAVVTLLASLSLGLPSYAAAGVSASDTGARIEWVRRIREARAALDDAHARYAAAVHAYGDMRHRRRERGEAKAAVIEEQEAARNAVTQAAKDLDALLAHLLVAEPVA